MPGVAKAKSNNHSKQVPLSLRREYIQPNLNRLNASPELTQWVKRAGKPAVAFVIPSRDPDKIRYLLSVKQLQHLTPLDAPTLDNISWHERIPNRSALNPENDAVTRTTLLQLLQTLPPSQKRVLELRNGLAPDHPGHMMTLKEAGKIIGYTRERARQKQNEALKNLKKKISNLRKLSPYREWLNDQEALTLIMETLSSKERKLFEITYKYYSSQSRAAKSLNKPQGKIRAFRNKLRRKLDEIYKIIQEVGLQNIKTPEQLRALYENSIFIGKVKQTAPKKKVEESLSLKEKKNLLAQGYKKLATPDRDLGEFPIKIPELASVISGYDRKTIYGWIIDTPETVDPNTVLLLNRLFLRGSSHQRKLALEHRRRRVRWALEFARKNSLKYSSLDEFCEARLGFSCRFANSIKRWMFTDPELIKIFEEYQEVITKPDRSAAFAWAPPPLIQNADHPHPPSDAAASAHKHSAG